MSRIINRSIVAAFFALALPLCAAAQKDNTVPMPVVNPDTVMKHIVELSSETYEGRLAGSEGYNRAMRYVEGELARYGVKPFDGKKWQLPFKLECNEVENAKFNVYMPGSKVKRVFSLGNEFCCAGATGRGYVDAQMVFCGYGIDNALCDEYATVDAKGKIVVVLTGLPANHPMPQAVADRYVSLRDKARAAERHGAIGMMVVTVTPTCPDDEPQGRAWCGEMPHMPTFPVLILSHDCGREIFHGEQMELDSAIAAIALEQTASFALLKKAEIDINAYYSPQAGTANVVGILEGSDAALSREIIVVGASMDGLGMQGETCLFPSADINASGVAAVLETARLLSQTDYRPRRSVAFVLFSGSEQQYLGSRSFIADFPLLRRVEAFVNVQNIGYGDSLLVLGDNRYPALWNLARFCDTSAHVFNNSFKELQRIWPEATITGNLKGDSVVRTSDCRFPVMRKSGNNNFLADGRYDIMLSNGKSNPRGDARAFDKIGIPSVVITTHDGMHHNHVTTDMWENIDRRILTLATQLTSDLVAQLGEGLYQGRSQQSKLLRD